MIQSNYYTANSERYSEISGPLRSSSVKRRRSLVDHWTTTLSSRTSLSLQECQRHVRRFADHLSKYINLDNPNALAITKVQAAWLKLREEDFNAKREQVRSHRGGVHLIISMVTMWVRPPTIGRRVGLSDLLGLWDTIS